MLRTTLAVPAAGLLLLSAALAHSSKEGSLPEDGAQLTAAPEELAILFDEPATLTRVELIHSHDGTSEEARLSAPREASSESRLAAPDFGPGVYTVDWRALSADGHPVNGSFSFTVTAP